MTVRAGEIGRGSGTARGVTCSSSTSENVGLSAAGISPNSLAISGYEAVSVHDADDTDMDIALGIAIGDLLDDNELLGVTDGIVGTTDGALLMILAAGTHGTSYEAMELLLANERSDGLDSLLDDAIEIDTDRTDGAGMFGRTTLLGTGDGIGDDSGAGGGLGSDT